MNRLWLVLSFMFLCAVSVQAQGVRFGDGQPVWRANTGGGAVISVLNAAINFCYAPANAVPCTNKATTYTDATLTTPCSTSTQVVLAGTTVCVAVTDPYGNWGVWAGTGSYAYTVTAGGQNYGPFAATLAGGVYTFSSSAISGNITTKTLATAGPNGNKYLFTASGWLVTPGSSCSTNTTLALFLNFIDPIASLNNDALVGLSNASPTPTTNVVIALNNGTQLPFMFFPFVINAAPNTAVQFGAIYTLGSGCSPSPIYKIDVALQPLT